MRTKRMEIVIDTWLMERASSDVKAVQLLKVIIEKCHKIILDYDAEILSEYSRHMKGYAKKFFAKCSMEGKIDYKAQANLHEEFRKKAIDPDDIKFLCVCINTVHKIFIKGDRKLLKHKNQLKKRFKVHILDVVEALHLLSA